MRVIYWLYDVTADCLAVVIAIIFSVVVIPLEKLGVIKLDQSYEQTGKVDV